MNRRDVLLLGASALTTAVARRARAQQPAEVKAALIMPLSGAWARSGDLSRKGA
jgi:hypothetical protein